MMTQMSPGNIQETVVTKFHEVMNHFNIPTSCNCDTHSATKRKCPEVNSNPKKLKVDLTQVEARKNDLLNPVASNSLAKMIGPFVNSDDPNADTSGYEDEDETMSSIISKWKDDKSMNN